MKTIVIHSGFHPEVKREYKGEHIYKVIKRRGDTEFNDYLTGAASNLSYKLYKLESEVWIKDLGDDKYVTDWTDEERWGRVEELETDDRGDVTSRQDLGFMILRVDRSKGLL